MSVNDPNTVHFVVDSMLGKLAKWLRLLGYDAIYDSGLDDRELAGIANQQGRVLLTRDRHLAEEFHVDKLYIVLNDTADKQIREVVGEFELDTESYFFTRCSVCNVPVQPASREDVAGRVPDHVFKSEDVYHVCPKCRRVYWAGTHFENSRKFIEKIL